MENQQFESVISSTLNINPIVIQLLSNGDLGKFSADGGDGPSLPARRLDKIQLKNQLELGRCRMHKKSCALFGLVKNALGELESEMDSIDADCDEMDTRLSTLKQQASRLLSETDKILAQREEINGKKLLVGAFLARFTVSQEDQDTLTKSESVSKEFFLALSCLSQAHHECKMLLMAEKNQAGIDILEQISVLQDSAYDRLFQWMQVTIRTFNKDSPEISGTLRDAVQALKSRSVLLQTVLDDVIIARRNTVARCFSTALSSGGAGDGHKPIEFFAHDPLRYTGDMLAWVHQSACNEREILQQLLCETDDVDQRQLLASPLTSIEPEISEIITGALDRIFEGICRQLRIRIDQVLASLTSVNVAYKTANMIQFYSKLLDKALSGRNDSSPNSPALTRKATPVERGSHPQLLGYLEDITQSAFKIFYDLLNKQATIMLRAVDTPPSDLSPPDILLRTVTELKELMSNYDSSLVLPLTPGEAPGAGFRAYHASASRETGFASILGLYIEPLVRMCSQCAERLDDSFKRSTFMLNCVQLLTSSLSLYPSFTKRRHDLLEVQLEVYADAVVQEECNLLMKMAGLWDVAMAVSKAREQSIRLTEIPGMTEEFLKAAIADKFDAFICLVNLEVSNHLSPILSPRYANIIAKRSVKMFTEEYGQIVAELDKCKLEGTISGDFVVRSVGEVETVVAIK